MTTQQAAIEQMKVLLEGMFEKLSSLSLNVDRLTDQLALTQELFAIATAEDHTEENQA